MKQRSDTARTKVPARARITAQTRPDRSHDFLVAGPGARTSQPLVVNPLYPVLCEPAPSKRSRMHNSGMASLEIAAEQFVEQGCQRGGNVVGHLVENALQ